MTRDHSVSLVSEDDLKKLAAQLRRQQGIGELDNTFSINDVVISLVERYKSKGPISLHVKRRSKGEPRARVVFMPDKRGVNFYIDDRVWELAKRHHGRSRFVIAHEIGHLLLHQHYEQRFTRVTSAQLRARLATRVATVSVS